MSGIRKSRHSRRNVPPKRSHTKFALGARTAVQRTLTPRSVNDRGAFQNRPGSHFSTTEKLKQIQYFVNTSFNPLAPPLNQHYQHDHEANSRDYPNQRNIVHTLTPSPAQIPTTKYILGFSAEPKRTGRQFLSAANCALHPVLRSYFPPGLHLCG